jgi:hypothetical protein
VACPSRCQRPDWRRSETVLASTSRTGDGIDQMAHARPSRLPAVSDGPSGIVWAVANDPASSRGARSSDSRLGSSPTDCQCDSGDPQSFCGAYSAAQCEFTADELCLPTRVRLSPPPLHPGDQPRGSVFVIGRAGSRVPAPSIPAAGHWPSLPGPVTISAPPLTKDGSPDPFTISSSWLSTTPPGIGVLMKEDLRWEDTERRDHAETFIVVERAQRRRMSR